MEKDNKEMQVRLIGISGLEGIRAAVIQPYDATPKNVDKLIIGVCNDGHTSIARHCIVEFEIKNISQSLLRQISRHPFLNLTVKSSRYCDMSNAGYYIPPNVIKMGEEKVKEYKEDMDRSMATYGKWKGYEGKEKLDIAKLVLPLGSFTSLVVSANIQAMYEMLQLRLCVRTEAEFRDMALLMKEKLANHDEYIVSKIFAKLGCKGDIYGICPEGSRGCGKYKKK